jgi:hypothetical protein
VSALIRGAYSASERDLMICAKHVLIQHVPNPDCIIVAMRMLICLSWTGLAVSPTVSRGKRLVCFVQLRPMVQLYQQRRDSTVLRLPPWVQ